MLRDTVMNNGDARNLPRAVYVADVAMSLLLCLIAFAAIRQQSAPVAAPADSPLAEFSSSRAMKHLQAIAGAPRPVGSSAHAGVRDYIMAQLISMGLRPELQTTTVNSNRHGFTNAATVQNIAAKLKGEGGGKAVMLASHYDSVATGNGASDDGAAVAAVLETVRALKTGSALKNDVLLLFTDGEEAGLLGAKAFVDEHPWAKDVGVVLNFEARGNSGPSIMFETSDKNGWLIGEFARSAPHPVANSLAYEIYRLLPNDTDLSIFKEAGLAGYGFAYIGGLTRYHTQLDNVENVDERSLQHHGSYALALARRLGTRDLENRKEPNAIYFNPFGTFFIHYPGVLAAPLMVFTVLLFAGVVVLGFRKKRLTVPGIAWGALASFMCMVIAPTVVALAWWLIRKVHGGYELILQGDTYNGYFYMTSFVLLTVALTSAVYRRLGKRGNVESLTVGGLFWWVILTVAVTLFLPGGSYLFTWPLLSTLAGLGIVFALRRAEAFSLKPFAALTLCALPGVLLFSPLIQQVFIGLSLRMSGVVMLLLVILLGLLVPQLRLMNAFGGRRWIAALVLVSLGFIAAGSMTSGFSPDRREPYNLFYALDADTGRAVWASYFRQRNEWTSRLLPAASGTRRLPEYFPGNEHEFVESQAPPAALSPPEIQVLGDSRNNGSRTLRLRVVSARRAPFISVSLKSSAVVARAAVNGRPVLPRKTLARAAPDSPWVLNYYALPEDGVELTLELSSSQPVEIRVIDRSYGFPELPGMTITSRPNYLMPAPIPYSDTTMVGKTFNL
jgi:Peptidase family M28